MSNYTIELNDEEYEAVGALLHFGIANLQRLVGTITAPEKDETENTETEESTEETVEEEEETDDRPDEEFTLDTPAVMDKLAPYGFGRQTLYRKVSNGTLPAPKKIRGRYYWKPQDIDAWIEENPLVKIQPSHQKEQS